MHYIELTKRGYVVVDVTPDDVTASWYLIDNVDRRRAEEMLAARFRVLDGDPHLIDQMNR